MKNKSQITIELHGKILYKVRYKVNWSIVIIPDNILIDNYHMKGGHIHTDPQNHIIQQPIKTNDLETAHNIIYEHIDDNNKGLNLKKLIKELTE